MLGTQWRGHVHGLQSYGVWDQAARPPRVLSTCWSHGRDTPPNLCCQLTGLRPPLSTCTSDNPIQHTRVYG